MLLNQEQKLECARTPSTFHCATRQLEDLPQEIGMLHTESSSTAQVTDLLQLN